MPARIDVMMPAYNAAATIGEAIDSLLTQTVRDIRVIVVNDGSTDATPAILAKVAEEDDRVVVVNKTNDGIVEARNDALAATSAEFLACLDSDDIALPDRFDRQLAYLNAHPNCIGVGGAVAHVDEHGVPIHGMTNPGSPSDADAAKAPALEPYIVHSTLMVRRADVMAVGGYRHVPNSEDSDLFWRLLERGVLTNLPDTFAKYRVHTASVSSSLVNGRIMAVGSQLGALSARRRSAGREDLTFPRALHDAMKKAVTFEAMYTLAAANLDADEAEHLRIAASAKLMELAGYRPFEPDVADCIFIRAALPLSRDLSASNKKELDWYVSATSGRLMQKRLLSEFAALTPPKNYPMAAARALLVHK